LNSEDTWLQANNPQKNAGNFNEVSDPKQPVKCPPVKVVTVQQLQNTLSLCPSEMKSLKKTNRFTTSFKSKRPKNWFVSLPWISSVFHPKEHKRKEGLQHGLGDKSPSKTSGDLDIEISTTLDIWEVQKPNK